MVVMMPDWAGGSSVNPTPPKRTAPRPSSPGGNTFNTKPRPSTPGGNTFNYVPPYRPPAPAPYRPPAPVYQAPAYSPPPPVYNQPAQIMPYYPPQPSFGGGGQSFGGGGQSFAPSEPIEPPPPPPPPKPPVGGAEWFAALGPTAKEAQRNKFLGGDSDYTAQIGQYDRALAQFIDRISKQKKLFEQDAADAIQTTGQNEGLTLNNMGEDFGARGLSYSGLFDQEKQQTQGRFNETRGNIGKQKTRNITDASNREADYRSENQVSRGNARRAALQRMAAEQALKDANAGF